MSELKFTATHEWLKQEGDTVMIGITDHAQQLLGDLVFIDLPEEGKTVHFGDELGVLESVKAASDFYAPVGGTVIAVNAKVSEKPALVNTDPYGEGWLVKMTMTDPEEVHSLLSEAQYRDSMLKED